MATLGHTARKTIQIDIQKKEHTKWRNSVGDCCRGAQLSFFFNSLLLLFAGGFYTHILLNDATEHKHTAAITAFQ